MAATLRYLTVQDVLWINLEATHKRSDFRYATLEEATYYQYAYGGSDNPLPQAARFVAGFHKLNPFDSGNQVTAFVGVLAFLRANGHGVKLTDAEAVDWFAGAARGRDAALEALSPILEHAEEDGHEAGPSVRDAIRTVLREYPSTVRILADRG